MRVQDNANYYFFSVGIGGSFNCSINYVVGGVQNPPNPPGTVIGNVAHTPVAGRAYILDCSVYGSNPTTLNLKIYDTVSTTYVVNLTAVDNINSAVLQQLGAPAIIVSTASTQGTLNTVANNTTIPGSYTQATVYEGTPPSDTMTFTGPTTGGIVGIQSGNYTLTPNNTGPATTLTVTLGDGSQGGTFKNNVGTTVTTLTFPASVATPQTFTYTPATSGTIVITPANDSSGAIVNSPTTISYVVTANGLIISPTSTPGGPIIAGTPISVTVVNTTVSGSPISISGGFKPSLISQTLVDSTHVTANIDPGSVFMPTTGTSFGTSAQTVTISATGVTGTALLSVVAPTYKGTVNYFGMGDSITEASLNSVSPRGAGVSQCIGTMRSLGWQVQYSGNFGINGAATDQWIPNSTQGINGHLDQVFINEVQYADGVSNFITTLNGTVTASFSGTVMTVTTSPVATNQFSSPTPTQNIYPGSRIVGAGLPVGLLVTTQAGGTTGGIGTYNLSANVGTVGSATVRYGAPDTSSSNVGPGFGNSGLFGGCYYDMMIQGMVLAGALNSSGQATGSNATYVGIMLGTNDVHSTNTTSTRAALTPAQHLANMTLICNDLVARGVKVIIHHPIWTWPYSGSAPTNYPGNCNDTYALYWNADMTLVNGTTIFAGDTANFSYFRWNNSQISADGIHPNTNAAYAQLGLNQGNASTFVYGLGSGGGGGGGNFWNNFPNGA